MLTKAEEWWRHPSTMAELLLVCLSKLYLLAGDCSRLNGTVSVVS